MEPARTDRVGKQAKDKDPAARAVKGPAPEMGVAGAGVVEPAKAKAAAVAAVRVRVADKGADAARIAKPSALPTIRRDTIMPGFDRSGPIGVGPMTGGGRGMCGRPAVTGNLPRYGRCYGHGRGRGFGRGGGRGWERSAEPDFGRYGILPASKADEIEMLRTNADAMQRSLEAIQGRLAELEKEGSA